MNTYTIHVSTVYEAVQAITVKQEDALTALLTALESLQIIDLSGVYGIQIERHPDWGERQER